MDTTATPAKVRTETYHFDPSHTTALWHCSHFGFSTPTGQFTMIDGVLELDEGSPQNSKIKVTIHPASVSTGIEKFNEHLKSKDFFNVEQFSTAIFVSDRIVMTGNNTAKVHGTLTLLGVSRTVVLDATINKIDTHPMTNKKTCGFSAHAKIKRSDFGMNAYLPGVGDEVILDIEAEASLVD